MLRWLDPFAGLQFDFGSEEILDEGLPPREAKAARRGTVDLPKL
jgi:hypothetical protein